MFDNIRYGSEAGELTDNTMYAVGQSAMLGHNISSLGVKGVAKRAAKDTGKALVLNHKDNKKAMTQHPQEGDAVEGMDIGQEVIEGHSVVKK